MSTGKLDVFLFRLYNHADREGVVDVYRSAMSTAPWFEDLPTQVVKQRIETDFIRPKSQQFVGIINHAVYSAMWWDQTNFDLLKRERGEALAIKWQEMTSGAETVWFRDLLVQQEYQGKGIGSQMLDFAIEEWKSQRYRYALLRVHLGGVEKPDIPSNIKAIKLYQKKGFTILPDICHITQLSHDKDHNKVKMRYMIFGF